ncbi:S-adenosylmethionine:tRNA ribosyltransferase-isomerase [Arachidicoccus rhizosphaerae]|uniref:S-adenosylmethionine:tRNA ribosyltransferase-isomerase n=1 Tax=Arachidicoccus rhizosphaerae TaxID=551991 RepID=A0A1H3XV05_9BACT|nr:S-adenosylmethionine:tRNA ribosyltransferase-isomerase [Arachidicoccus rhizosphaerae]SEA03153.1 S-adenosylmethionine:tRNA ribosyltransferase-isomerase [Arachidicoccus rhizosphaerae]
MTDKNEQPGNTARRVHPEELSIEDFDYPLPDSRIAKYPLTTRDQSKLLIFNKNNQKDITERIYRDLDEELPKGSLLVFNNTKVVEARLLFKKQTGSTIELFCLEPAGNYPDITTAMLSRGEVLWKCLVGGAKKWKSGPLTLEVAGPHPANTVTVTANKIEKQGDSFIIQLNWTPVELSFAEILHLSGQLPLPPYLNRATEAQDLETYQTVYAKQDGSVAAPTAGLHFTKDLLKRLADKGIKEAFVTLHVGAGTFKPVKADKMKDHEMHAEFMEIPCTFIETLLQQAKLKPEAKILAVGTTSLRTLESLYWMGVKLLTAQKDPYIISQWEPYQLEQGISLVDSLAALWQALQNDGKSALITHTQIIIAPGYNLRVADAILTNFHQPHSTLLLLIAAVVGNHWKSIYEYALGHDFRFLSYGDGSLLWQVKP